MVELRQFQRELLGKAQRALEAPRARVMLQLPTGGGKTSIAAALLDYWTTGGGKAAWVTHRGELAEQTRQVLEDAGIRARNSFRTGDTDWPVGKPAPATVGGVVIHSAPTATHRFNHAEESGEYEVWEEYGEQDLLVVDEAHHATAHGWETGITQWPGRVIGLTATPWRLSKNEGFEHLFDHLILGPQIGELQSQNWLANADVRMPRQGDLILGGQLAGGEFTQTGIVNQNRNRHIWTGGALEYWKEYAQDRQTLIYAVTVDHAEGLVNVFNSVGVTAAAILGNTPSQVRADRIRRFSEGQIRVLVNVAVATEGFDLPAASCVVLTRPTMSEALYLQMIGRGLRPKPDNGDCVILDLAGNVERHGLPDKDRLWSLKPRNQQVPSDSPVIRCTECDGVSHAASHACRFCGHPFGKKCQRCGAWRSWKRWSLETYCGSEHDLVCNLCHYDAHKLAVLPVNDGLKGELEQESQTDDELKLCLDSLKYDWARYALQRDRSPFLRNLLEEERLRARADHDNNLEELRQAIQEMESWLANPGEIDRRFEEHLKSLQTHERPTNRRDEAVAYLNWEEEQKAELARMQRELSNRENLPVDKHQILYNARVALRSQRPDGWQGSLGALLLESHAAGLWPDDKWVSVDWLHVWKQRCDQQDISIRPRDFCDSEGEVFRTSAWAQVIIEVAEWLIREGHIPTPFSLQIDDSTKYVINDRPVHANGTLFANQKELSNGLFLEVQWPSAKSATISTALINRFDQIPSQLYVRLEDT